MSESNGRFKLVDDPDLQLELLKPVPFVDLVSQYPALRPPIIDGLIRQGEVANIIASPKVGKSFLAGNLAWSVATGSPFLGFNVQSGKVLVIDNELHPETMASRLDHIADKMMVSYEDRNMVDTLSLRGRLSPINTLGMILDIDPSVYSVIVLDALYRSIPAGVNENENTGMMTVYNELDSLAAKWQSAIVLVHHATKGQQGDKGVTDMGAGAGAIARAADTHIAIRPHEDGEHCVWEAVCRSFKSPDPVSIKFEYPLWHATTAEPIVKKTTRHNADKQRSEDDKAITAILKLIPVEKPVMQQTLIRKCGLTQNRGLRLLSIIESKDLATRSEKRRKGYKQKTVLWQSKSESKSESSPN